MDVAPDFVQNDILFSCAKCKEQVSVYYIVPREVAHCPKTITFFKLCGACYATTNGGAA
jgi:hypothetical protein